MKPRGLALIILAASICSAAQQAPPASHDPEHSPSLPPTSAPRPELDLTLDADGKLSQQQMQAMLRVAAENFRDNSRKQRDYTYVWRDVEHDYDNKGETKSTEIRTYEVMQLYGEQVIRLVQKDDKPLDAKDAAKEEERIQKLADKRKNESDEQRQKREAEQQKQRDKGIEFLRDVADAYNFTDVGSEAFNGRDVWVIDCEPRPDFHPKLKDSEKLSKIRGRLWIDKAELQLAKMDISVFDTISFGWVLARIHGGTRFEYERTRVNDEVWLPLHYEGKLDARVALFKSENAVAEGNYRDYKKFRTSSRIVSVGDAKQ